MRAFGSFILWVLALLIVVVVTVFAVQNLTAVNARFLGYTLSAGLWLIVAASAVLGFVLAALLMMPGRLATGWRARSLARSRAQTESELAALQEEHAQLQAEHDRLAADQSGLQAERDQLEAERERALQARRDREQRMQRQPVVAGAPAAPADTVNRSDTATPTDTAVPSQRPAVYTHEPDQAAVNDRTDRTDRTEAGVDTNDRPTLSDRLRGMFRRPDNPDGTPDETYGGYDQPPAPTA